MATDPEHARCRECEEPLQPGSPESIFRRCTACAKVLARQWEQKQKNEEEQP